MGCGGARGRMLEWREECPERSKCRIVVNVEIDDQINIYVQNIIYASRSSDKISI
jgi:hypothetical protein